MALLPRERDSIFCQIAAKLQMPNVEGRMLRESVTISRNDEIYECFPDLMRLETGTLLCVYRESNNHTAEDFCDLVWRTSDDDGKTWGNRHVLVESRPADGELMKWNCPRTGVLADGRVYILCDQYPRFTGHEDEGSTTWIWWSNDGGETWADPVDTGVKGIVPDQLCELPSGRLLLSKQEREPMTGKLRQRVCISDDGGRTWSDSVEIAFHPDLHLCEGSILRLPDGTLVCYMRENSMKGLPVYKAISKDDGESWVGPFETPMHGGHRPVAGFLPSGHVMVVYRYTTAGKGFAKGVFAYRESVESAAEVDVDKQEGRFAAIDHDRSARLDTGYVGWVTLPDGRAFIANYINDDAPKAQIRGYWISESDFIIE
jgi:hypothetical protein